MAEFKNIFIGKKVVQQAWLGDRVQIFQSPGWETTPMTVQQVWAKSLASEATDMQVDSDDNFYVLRDGRVEKYNSDGESIHVYPETDAGSFVIDNKDRLIVSRYGNIARYFKNEGLDAQLNVASNNRLENMHVDKDDNVFANISDTRTVYMISHYFQSATKLGTTIGVPREMILDKDNNIYTCSSDDVYFIDKYDSKMKKIWKKSLSYTGSALAIDSQGFVYVGIDNGNVLKLRPDDGKLVNSIVINADVVVDLAIDSQDNLYVATDDGNVSKYSSDGTKIWGYGSGDCTAITIDSNNNVYVGDTSGKIVKQLQLKQVGPNR